MIDQEELLEIFWSLPVEGDENGEIDVFGTKVANAPLNFQAVANQRFKNRLNEELNLETDAAKTLIKNAGHTCGYFVFTGMYESEFWEENVAPKCDNELDEARALHLLPRVIGFGNYSIDELTENKYKVRSYNSYESEYYLKEHENHAENPRCNVMAGALAAVMNVVFVDNVYDEKPDVFSPEAFWAKEIKCRSQGDPYCEFVIHKGYNFNNDIEPPVE